MSLELRIRQLLIDYSEPSRAADEILKLWDQGSLSSEEQEIAGRFLLNAEFLPSLLTRLGRNIRNRQIFSWSNLIDALVATGIRISKEDFDSILLGASESNQIENLVRSRALDVKEPRISKIRSRLRVQAVEDEGRAKVDPNVFRLMLLKEHQGTPELSAAGDHIGGEFVKRAQQNPESAYVIAVSLLVMGLANYGIEALEVLSATDVRKNWLHLELLLEAGRTLEALELAERLEQTHRDSAELLLSAMYGRALALSELGRQAEARAVLEEILTIEPNFRSAHSLLLKWLDEGPR